ncbi:MAG: CHAT domain-containing protein [Lewinellaceae bacterium]|nr:CHAT domain-containing protein [Lewinellaceae bacterium]
MQSSLIANQLAAAAPDSIQLIYEDWKNTKRQLAEVYTFPKTERMSLDSLENQSISLEKQLVQNLPGFSEARREVRWQDVQSALKMGETAVEFVDFEDKLADPPGKHYYAALVLRHGEKAPEFVPLFEEQELLALTNRSKSWLADYTEKLYAKRQTDGTKSLYQLVWQPLEAYFSGGEKIWFSASGLIHRLNLEAIQTPDNQVLGDKFNFSSLGSTRQLTNRNAGKAPENRTAAIFGGIRYEADSTAIVKENADLALSSSTVSSRTSDFPEADSTLRGNNWNYLPATEKEVTDIEKQLIVAKFNVIKRTGFAASEEALKSFGGQLGLDGYFYQNNKLASPRILHIATHGFFFPDPGKNSGNKRTIFKVSENPLLRSGLVLSGANHAWKTGKPLSPNMEDGILTALEIAQMDLSSTELVVLSACETGLGDLAGNEGVYGLQRAFKIAGAQYLVMSLWKINDEKTGEFMAIFYEKWLLNALEIPAAFRAAQSQMRQKYPNPFFWAGFVLVE